MKKSFLILLLSLLALSCNSEKKQKIEEIATSTTFNKFTNLVDTYANETLKKKNANSFALAIYKDGNMYQKYYGELEKGSNIKPSDSSLYEIASITKTFIGSLVAKSVLSGKLNLDDDIRKYFDGNYPNLEFEGQPITIKHLLTHSMGLKNKLTKGFESIRNKVINGTYDFKTDSYTIDDLLIELKTVEVDKKPGTVFVYNSLGPELLAYILEKVNKQSFNKQITTFFKEIGMHNTYLQDSENHLKYLVRGYDGDLLENVDYFPIYGAAGGAIATLPDVATYMKYLVEHKNKPWINEASRILFTDEENDEQIGYLWQNIGFAKEEGYFYSKTGTSNGTQSGILICPDSNYGIVLMVNSTSEDAYNNWATLFFRDIEPDVIKYPKLNLLAMLKPQFIDNTEKAIIEYKKLKVDTAAYFMANANVLNNFGYQILNDNSTQSAIEVFTFATEEFPENANLYDSLGEVYFMVEDYKNALINYKKSLQLNPESENAKTYIKKCEALSKL